MKKKNISWPEQFDIKKKRELTALRDFLFAVKVVLDFGNASATLVMVAAPVWPADTPDDPLSMEALSLPPNQAV